MLKKYFCPMLQLILIYNRALIMILIILTIYNTICNDINLG